MKTYTLYAHHDKHNNSLARIILRLLVSTALYLCFGLLAEYAYANHPAPSDSTRGSVWLRSDDGSTINALLLQTEVDLNISGMIVRALVKQRFKNTRNLWAEAVYVFPLPENAAVDHFRLRIGARQIEGQIQERKQARKTYETAVNEGRKAGLVEQQRPNVFTTSLANVAPGEEITVEIEYQQTLEYKDGSYRLRFPMVIGPRYKAANHLLPGNDDAPEVSTAVSSKLVNPVYIHVSLDAGVPLAELDSTYHAIEVKQTDTHRYSIVLAPGKVFADRDFELVWRPELDQQPQTAVFTEQHDSYEYMLLSVLPPSLEALGQQLLPRDVIFVLDVSGSMGGTAIEQAKASLLQAFTRLGPEERFNIIWFNDHTEQLFTQAMPATANNIDYASKTIERLEADGGTVMLPALALALNQQPDPSRIRQIIFLTDGNVDNEQGLFTLISKQLGDNRLFTIGIGSAPNSYFMRKAARAGRGTFTYIGNIDEVQQKTNTLLKKLESPALVNIDLDIDGVDIEAFPDPVPDLYTGDPVTVLLRARQPGTSITLYGDYGETVWKQTVQLPDTVNHSGIYTSWARQKIASLLEQQHDAKTEYERERFRNQIVKSSIDHHLVSRYTSLVAVDVTPVNSSGQLYSETLKTNLPHGWKPGPGNQLASQPILTAQLSLPQTATSASMHIMIASMLLALAMVFYLWRKML